LSEKSEPLVAKSSEIYSAVYNDNLAVHVPGGAPAHQKTGNTRYIVWLRKPPQGRAIYLCRTMFGRICGNHRGVHHPASLLI
jgi:hypothetical protein